MYKLLFIPARANLRSWLPVIGPSRAPAAPQASAPSSVGLDAAADRPSPPAGATLARRWHAVRGQRLLRAQVRRAEGDGIERL